MICPNISAVLTKFMKVFIQKRNLKLKLKILFNKNEDFYIFRNFLFRSIQKDIFTRIHSIYLSSWIHDFYVPSQIWVIFHDTGKDWELLFREIILIQREWYDLFKTIFIQVYISVHTSCQITVWESFFFRYIFVNK